MDFRASYFSLKIICQKIFHLLSYPIIFFSTIKIVKNSSKNPDCPAINAHKRGKNILHYTLCKKRKHIQLKHYPEKDRIDTPLALNIFYHCHRENFAEEEHGHFIVFYGINKSLKHIKPAPLPDWDKYIKNPMTHIIAIAMNRLGQPIRLFTVIDGSLSEIWYEAKQVPRLINRFNMTLENDPYWKILDTWIEG